MKSKKSEYANFSIFLLKKLSRRTRKNLAIKINLQIIKSISFNRQHLNVVIFAMFSSSKTVLIIYYTNIRLVLIVSVNRKEFTKKRLR